MATQKILILDFGSQYTKLIARRVRELGFYCLIENPKKFENKDLLAVILSGGPASVNEPGAPDIDKKVLLHWIEQKIPVLGICYGMQLIAKHLGGKIVRDGSGEYGRAMMVPESAMGFELLGKNPSQVWMSHGDKVTEIPAGFRVIAKSETGILAGMEGKGTVSLQFHPEVTHTTVGVDFLKKFLTQFANLKPNWTMKQVVHDEIEKIRAQVPAGKKVIGALSGGVDSAVAAVLVKKAIGEQLQCVFVDHGLLRLNERQEVMGSFKEVLKLPVTCIDASDRFLGALKGVEDPEEKRKKIGEHFIRVFEEHVRLDPVDFLLQGTLYPDVIESSGILGSAKIKSHHNVGGLPEKMNLKLIEPLRELFKDEVRALGRELGIPDAILSRHPFPGPGLAVRILGEVTRERVQILQRVDHIFIDEIKKASLYDAIWQAFAVLLPVRSVGVQGDGRTHGLVAGLRAVTSQDGMTADWFSFEQAFLSRVSNRICNEIREVNRVVLDVTSKPPATIEWE